MKLVTHLDTTHGVNEYGVGCSPIYSRGRPTC